MTCIAIDARYISNQFSGIGVYSQNYLQALSALRLNAEFAIMIQDTYNEDLRLGSNFHIVKSSSRPVSVASLFGIERGFRRYAPNALHTLAPLVPLTWRDKRPLIATVHDMQPLQDRKFTWRENRLLTAAYDAFYRFAYPKCMRHADWIICPSYATKRYISEYVPDVADKVIVIHEAVPNDMTRPSDKQIERTRNEYNLPKRYLLYIGSTRPNKNLKNMIEAFDTYIRSNSSGKDLHLVLVLKQDRFWEPISALIRERGLTERIHIFEDVSSIEKRVFYSQAELLYFVTKYEGFGLPVLEAQAMELPVLASTHSALPEIAGSSALLAEADSVDSIVDKLEVYFEQKNYGLRDSMIAAGLENTRRFSWQRVVREHLTLYKVLAGVDLGGNI